MSDSKAKALTKVKAELEEQYGETSVRWAHEIPVRPLVSSGSLALDFACGGGFPSDHCIEVAGAEGCGKTSLGLLTMRNFLDVQPDRGAVILDLEHKLTVSWVEQLLEKERMERVILLWPDHMEEATDMYTKAVASGHISFVMVDSIGGAPSQRVTNKSAEIGNIGGNALAVTRFAQLASIYSQKYNTLTFGINQTRQDISGYHRHIVPGGQAWKHACVIRILMSRGKGKIEEKIGGENIPVGYQVVSKVVKNQIAAPGRVAEYWFFNVPTDKWAFGIDTLDEMIRLAILTDVIRQGGKWYYHSTFPNGQIDGKASMIQTVRENPESQDMLRREIIEVVSADSSLAQLIAPLTEVVELET
jgi:recombination protein RecA